MRQPIVWVIALYGVAATVVIASSRVLPIVDDWIYIRGAQLYATEGVIAVPEYSVPNAIFESVVGGFALSVFGDSLVVLLAVSLVLSACSALAMNDLVLRSGGHRAGAAAAAAALLFVPAMFGLSLTYMTDIHALALAVIAVALYSRGVDGEPKRLLMLGGSLVVSLAYLSRPGAGAVVLGAVWVLARRREWGNLVVATALPASVLLVHTMHQLVVGVPEIRRLQIETIGLPSWSLIFDAGQAFVVQAGLLAIVFVPVAAAVVVPSTRRRQLLVAVGLLTLGSAMLMIVLGPPPTGDWLNVTGLFPLDNATIGFRTAIVLGTAFQIAVLLVGVIAGAGLALARRRIPTSDTKSAFVGLWVGASFAFGLTMVGPSQIFGNIHDRYLIVFFPAILLSMAAAWTVRMSRAVALSTALIIATLAMVSSLLAVDGFRIQDGVWTLADRANVIADEVTDVDGGSAWTGWHQGHLVTPETMSLPTGGDWWRRLYAPDIDPRYVVSLIRIDDACELDRIEVDRAVARTQIIYLFDVQC